MAHFHFFSAFVSIQVAALIDWAFHGRIIRLLETASKQLALRLPLKVAVGVNLVVGLIAVVLGVLSRCERQCSLAMEFPKTVEIPK